ncbi:MAG: acetate kinase, partial [Armatimonadia bacterium]|nr:acetate kinase [Armatimonadia bacterium]
MNVLVVNAGSSSLKYELYDMDEERSLAKGLCERVGGAGANIEQQAYDGREYEAEVEMADHSVAFEQAIAALTGDEAEVEADHIRSEAEAWARSMVERLENYT